MVSKYCVDKKSYNAFRNRLLFPKPEEGQYMKMLPSIFASLTWIVHLLAKIHFFSLQNHILGACKCFRCSFHLCFCFKLREILKVESPIILLGSYTLNVSVFRCLCTLSKCPPCNCFLLLHDLQAMTIGMLLTEASP